jgi:hypothetical protein
VPWIRADDTHDAVTAHDLALLAAFTDRCLNLHEIT